MLICAVRGAEYVLGWEQSRKGLIVVCCLFLRGAEKSSCLIISFRLGAIYSSGSFRMSTWIPFVWALINVLVLIVSSFSIQGGL